MDRQLKIEYIQDLLGFCYTDLENLTMKQKTSWLSNLVNLLTISFARDVRLDQLLFADRIEEQEWDAVKELQKELCLDIEWICSYLIDRKTYSFTLDVPYRFTLMPNDKYRFFSESKREGVDVKVFGEVEGYRHGQLLQQKKINSCFTYLLEAVDGFGISSLLKCPNCSKLFFNPTKRKKKYCSPQCQNAAAVQRLRKKKE